MMARDVFPRTISRGPLTGQTFASKWQYQQARAQQLGFTSYGAERAAKANPLFTVVQKRAESQGYPRGSAIQAARRIVGTSRVQRSARGTPRAAAERERMRQIIRAMMSEGLYDNGDDAADDVFY